jgi:hypothetical protein
MPSNQTHKSPRTSLEQRTRRRNQIIILVFSGILIFTMLISQVKP